MIYGRLNQLFNQAIRERVINENPCRLVSRAVLKEFPTWTRRERWLGKYEEDEEERLFKELDPRIATVCRLLLNTGLRPPREILLVEKANVNLSDAASHYRFTRRDGRHLEGRDTIIPPHALLVVHTKGGRPRMVPLNETSRSILQVLCADSATGQWLFVNRGSRQLGSIKKGFAAACERAGIEGLRPYDLRHTFATRLVERGVRPYVISALMGHTMPVSGFGHESRITPGYAYATWEAMVWAVESLEHPPATPAVFRPESGKFRPEGCHGRETEGGLSAYFV
jgi:integrase